ncbi:hypothetical protein [Spirosoma radiotolerans]|uniref:hypothetical protein n=1 Tax=Spirosoma radiotolerans TaxID=1379870 RepID=UPI001D101105|nr:hypothetical protein [Spirosoma radiotolerans]
MDVLEVGGGQLVGARWQVDDAAPIGAGPVDGGLDGGLVVGLPIADGFAGEPGIGLDVVDVAIEGQLAGPGQAQLEVVGGGRDGCQGLFEWGEGVGSAESIGYLEGVDACGLDGGGQLDGEAEGVALVGDDGGLQGVGSFGELDQGSSPLEEQVTAEDAQGSSGGDVGGVGVHGPGLVDGDTGGVRSLVLQPDLVSVDGGVGWNLDGSLSGGLDQDGQGGGGGGSADGHEGFGRAGEVSLQAECFAGLDGWAGVEDDGLLSAGGA